MHTRRRYSCNDSKVPVCNADSTYIHEKPDSFSWLKAFDPSRTYHHPGTNCNTPSMVASPRSPVLPPIDCPKAARNQMYRSPHYEPRPRETRSKPPSVTPRVARYSTVPTLPLLTIEEQEPPSDGDSFWSSKGTSQNSEKAVIEEPRCTGVLDRLSWPTHPSLPPRRQSVPTFHKNDHKTRRVDLLSGIMDDSYEGQYEKAFHVTFVLGQEARSDYKAGIDQTRGCRTS